MMTMPERIIIADTTFLDSIYRLKVTEKLSLFFSRLLIPIRVEHEFLSEKNSDRDGRYRYLSEIMETWQWIEKCNTFDSGTLKLLSGEPGIDTGEAEVMSQCIQLSLEVYDQRFLYVVIDEKRGRQVAKNLSLNLTGTLYILATLSLHHLLNFDDAVTSLQKQGSRFSKAVAKQALEKAKRDLSSGRFAI